MEQAIILLLDTYEKLLTDTQARLLRMRYDEDLSLSEIGELCGVSRQAARDGIRKGEEKLLFFESTLHLVALRRSLASLASRLENGSITPREAVENVKKLAEDPDGV